MLFPLATSGAMEPSFSQAPLALSAAAKYWRSGVLAWLSAMLPANRSGQSGIADDPYGIADPRRTAAAGVTDIASGADVV